MGKKKATKRATKKAKEKRTAAKKTRSANKTKRSVAIRRRAKTAKRVRARNKSPNVRRRASSRATAPIRRTRGTPSFAKSLDELDLSAKARAAADALVAKFASLIVFTSGRRSLSQQADAMSGNVVIKRTYIKETYVDTAESRQLQQWVDDNPGATTKQAIAQGLLAIMQQWTPAQVRNISYHPTGDAFDIAPVSGDDGKRIKEYMPQLPNYGKFLDKEAGLTIWHLQVKP